MKAEIKKTKKAVTRTLPKQEKTSLGLEVPVYSAEGNEAGKISLPQEIFGLPWNVDLVHQVVTSMESNARAPVAHTKNRGEVRGGGKKPWRQKGTGRARHGSIRSPIWVGGGVAHGPRKEKNYARKVNKRAKAKALFMLLSQKLRDGELLFVNSLGFRKPKAAQAKNILLALSKVKGYEMLAGKKRNAALVTTPGKDVAAAKSFRNFGNILVEEVRNTNPLHLLRYKFLIMADPAQSLPVFEKKLNT